MLGRHLKCTRYSIIPPVCLALEIIPGGATGGARLAKEAHIELCPAVWHCGSTVGFNAQLGSAYPSRQPLQENTAYNSSWASGSHALQAVPAYRSRQATERRVAENTRRNRRLAADRLLARRP